MTALADQTDRDRITRDHERTLFVEAGAGSGKTASLVSRMVALVAEGVDVTGVAAITFTEAAAAELRTRVRQALETLAGGEAVRGVDASELAASRAASALDRLDRSTICTLHAFAQRLLLAAPVEAGLPPQVEVHDDISSVLRFEDRWSRFERALLDDDGLAVVMRTALVLGITSHQLQTVAAVLGQNWDLVEEAAHAGLLDHDAGEVDPASLPVERWLALCDRIIEHAGRCTDDADTLACWVRDHIGAFRQRVLDIRADPYAVVELTRIEFARPGNKGRKDNWPDGVKDDVLALCATLREAVGAARAELTDRVLTRLGTEIARYTLRDADARRAEGRLEFHDLLVLARRLLRTQHAVRRRFHERFTHLLIDEFQDTDPIQVELAIRIAAHPDHDPATPWDEVDVAPGRLFFVGDPKQSIYRFRRADIDLFSRTALRYAEGYTSLRVNFRTVEPVLAFCNAVFERLIQREMAPGADGEVRIAQPDYVPLHVHREPIAGDPGPPVVVLGDGRPHERADQARHAEAQDVAAVLRRAHDDGWLVDVAGHQRPCRWSDMAVLLPSRTTLSQLRDQLDLAEVPYRLESGTLVYGTTEITDLLSILRAIDDPGDEIAAVGALRSPAYGCGDDDLRRWARQGRTFRHVGLRAEDCPPSPVLDALVDLRERHRVAPFTSVPEIVERVVRERRLMELCLAGGRHRDVWRLYRVVLEHARQFADTERGGLRAFLHWADLQRDDKIRASSPVIPEADVDAVRILTIHASKGLEFPVTVVSGLSAQDPNRVTGASVRFGAGGRFDVRMKKGMETARFEAVRTLEETMDEHERIRLLYVALTRARDHLVVSTHHTGRAAQRSHGGRLATELAAIEAEADGPLAERWTVAAPGTAVEGQLELFDPGDDAVEATDGADAPLAPTPDRVTAWQTDQAAWAAARARVLARSASGGVVTASGLAAEVAARSGEVDAASDAVPERAEPVTEPWRRGRAGTSVGSAVHAVLQHTDLTDPAGADLADLAAWQAGAEGIPHAAPLIEHKARLAVQSDLVRRAVSSPWWRRELHVSVPMGALGMAVGEGADLFEGFVDLVFDTDDGLVVVDYKTDDVGTSAAVDTALARYAPQGAAYALALEAATGRPVTEVHFLFLRGDEAVDVPVADLAGAVDAARVALGTMGA